MEKIGKRGKEGKREERRGKGRPRWSKNGQTASCIEENLPKFMQHSSIEVGPLSGDGRHSFFYSGALLWQPICSRSFSRSVLRVFPLLASGFWASGFWLPKAIAVAIGVGNSNSGAEKFVKGGGKKLPKQISTPLLSASTASYIAANFPKHCWH